jgi:hypothetical protein
MIAKREWVDQDWRRGYTMMKAEDGLDRYQLTFMASASGGKAGLIQDDRHMGWIALVAKITVEMPMLRQGLGAARDSGTARLKFHPKQPRLNLVNLNA